MKVLTGSKADLTEEMIVVAVVATGIEEVVMTAEVVVAEIAEVVAVVEEDN
jgi:hypothetical protein